MRFKKLYESFENERDIENLAKSIMNYYADFVLKLGIHRIFQVDSATKKVRWDTLLDFDTILKQIKFKAKTPELKALLKSKFMNDILFTNNFHGKKTGLRGQYTHSGTSKIAYRDITLFYDGSIMHTFAIKELGEYYDSFADNKYVATKNIPVLAQADSGLNPNIRQISEIKKGDILYIASIYSTNNDKSNVELDDDSYYGIDALELNNEDIKYFKKLEGEPDKSILKRISKTDILNLVNLRYTTLVHEFTHMLDDFQSHEKALSKRVEHKDDYKEYLRLPHEINARYTQTVSHEDMISQKVNYPERGHSLGGFDEYVRTFKHMFLGWNDIDEKDRKHLIKRLYKEYTTFTKEEELSVINRAFNPIFWGFVLEPKKKTDWREFYKNDKRLNVDIKKIGHQIIKALVSNKMKLPVLRKNYEGVIRALYDLFNPKENYDYTKFQKEFKLTDQQIEELSKRIRQYGDSLGLSLF